VRGDATASACMGVSRVHMPSGRCWQCSVSWVDPLTPHC
jgi:hypothetical protein